MWSIQCASIPINHSFYSNENALIPNTDVYESAEKHKSPQKHMKIQTTYPHTHTNKNYPAAVGPFRMDLIRVSAKNAVCCMFVCAFARFAFAKHTISITISAFVWLRQRQRVQNILHTNNNLPDRAHLECPYINLYYYGVPWIPFCHVHTLLYITICLIQSECVCVCVLVLHTQTSQKRYCWHSCLVRSSIVANALYSAMFSIPDENKTKQIPIAESPSQMIKHWRLTLYLSMQSIQ